MKDLSREYVQAIIDYGNISHAAKALYISQPYLSKFIKNLEQELGVEIINRKTTPVTLTYAGERYLYYMNKVENTVQKMQHEMHGISNLKRGRLKIGVSPILATYTLYQLLPHFMQLYPGVEIELVEEATETLENLLIQNHIDVCLNSLPITNPDIMYDYLYEEYNFIVIPSNHPMYKKDQTNQDLFDPSQLDGEKFILAKPGLGLRRFTNQVFSEYNIHPKIVLETTNAENSLRLANNGVAITIVPQCVIESMALSIEANLYPLKDPKFKSHIVISYCKNDTLLPVAEAFISIAKKQFQSIT